MLLSCVLTFLIYSLSSWANLSKPIALMSPVSSVFHTVVTVNIDILTLRVFIFIWGTRPVEAQFQIEAPRTDLGTLVVLSTFDSVTLIVKGIRTH